MINDTYKIKYDRYLVTANAAAQTILKKLLVIVDKQRTVYSLEINSYHESHVTVYITPIKVT